MQRCRAGLCLLDLQCVCVPCHFIRFKHQAVGAHKHLSDGLRLGLVLPSLHITRMISLPESCFSPQRQVPNNHRTCGVLASIVLVDCFCALAITRQAWPSVACCWPGEIHADYEFQAAYAVEYWNSQATVV